MYQTRNIVRQLIRQSNRVANVLRWNPTESDAHIQMKLEVCKYLHRHGIEFYTEAILKDGSGRCDIIAADIELIIEIAESETDTSLAEKQRKYPLRMVVIRTSQKFDGRLLN